MRLCSPAYDLDAFVLHGTDHGDPLLGSGWTERGVPFVTFGRPWATRLGTTGRGSTSTAPPAPASGYPAADRGSATARIASHRLAARVRHRRSSTGPSGWSRELVACGMAPDLDLLRTQDGVDLGRRARRAAELLALDAPRPTALVCASDSLVGRRVSMRPPRRGDHGAAHRRRIRRHPRCRRRPSGSPASSQPFCPKAAARCMEMLLTHLLDERPGRRTGAGAPGAVARDPQDPA